MAETGPLQDEVTTLGNSPGEIRRAVREIVAGTFELDADPVHDPEVHAAELAAFVSGPA
jgi:hypothetical protein